MELAAKIETLFPLQQPSLTETIGKLWSEFSSMKQQLQQAHREINRLKNELSKTPGHRAKPELDLASLRRRVAFYCHPDRGGDTALMSALNGLFDYLECSEIPEGGSAA